MVAVLAMATVAAAQPRALGARLGYGAEVSYQHTMGGENFLEVDAGWNIGWISAAAAYDFSIAPVGPLNFYAGPAVHAGVANLPQGGQGFALGVGAQVGLEYCFSFPLQLSLDWRPLFQFLPGTGFSWQSLALGVRYRFH